ncbi:hypothetical protein [Paludifilum halophilum]|uniref:Uncharacterized protein n=1 Tax=Paludifilum halophilum TaxID=1642702 RepID=A0A235B678_9BACL|nr:hypothetical protein [Paludifilum halophilum]OYD07742.1 hypothetical protein CHM34_09735 [Paludifilum halophilum]
MEDRKILNNEEENDKFQYWLMEMGDILDEFVEEMPKELQLDYSPKSLLRIEEWIISNYKTIPEIKSDRAKLDKFARYVGETFRRNLDGVWELPLDNPKYVFYGIPQIVFQDENISPICPLISVTTCVDRRSGKSLYKRYINRIS